MAVPWYIWCAVVAVTSAMIGVHWDISWHRSIGRDAFWTPAHMAIYLCGVLAGISCGYQILATTSGRLPKLRDASVRLWGFQGPLGAFIAAWGGITMLTSAPFDNWWHNAYGLDVKIISPPHTVLALGMFAVGLGTLMLVLGFMNRATGAARRLYEWLYIYVGGMLIVNILTFLMEYSSRVFMHSALFYRIFAAAVPVFLVGIARASQRKWAATQIAAVYMLFWAAINWILPLFPAQPKLGPVYNPVDHFVPSYFPFLLVLPALALDWTLSRTAAWPAWRRGAAAGAVLLAAFLAVQWPFANFLMSPASRNWFFFTNEHDYQTRATSYYVRNLFYPAERTAAAFWQGMGIAFLSAMLTSWAGLVCGNWMARVKR